jgi:signal transduction histidine kinase
MLLRLIGEDITINISLSGKPAPVLADQGQMEQIIINLMTAISRRRNSLISLMTRTSF